MAKKNKLSAYILLDKSTSMAGARWENAIAAINQYIETLKQEKVPAEITLAAFSGGINWNWSTPTTYTSYGQGANPETLNFTVLRDKVTTTKCKPIQPGEVHPNGNTPLYDATGRLLNMADDNANEKTVILIMTDGEENQSQTYNLKSIRDRINTCQKRGWEVVFLGAEFNADTIARSYGLGVEKVINTSLGNMGASMRCFATGSAQYTMDGASINTTAVRDKMAK